MLPELCFPKLRFRMAAEGQTSPVPIRVKVAIHTREPTAYDPPRLTPFTVSSLWFASSAKIATLRKAVVHELSDPVPIQFATR